MRHRVRKVEEERSFPVGLDELQRLRRVESGHLGGNGWPSFDHIAAQDGHAAFVDEVVGLPVVQVVQHAVVTVEALVQGPHALDETEVPFPDAAGGIAGILQDFGECHFIARQTVLCIGPQHARR